MSLLKLSLCKLPPLAPTATVIRHRFTAEDTLKVVLARKIPKQRERVRVFREEYGPTKVSDTTVDSIYSGMRDVTSLVCETSLLDAEEGIRFRGYTLAECQALLPKSLCGGGEQPLPEGIFWLLVSGDMPTQAQTRQLSKEWVRRASLPQHVTNMLDNMPQTLHPMSQLSCVVTALNHDSKFAKAFMQGVPRDTYWQYTYEDAMDLIAKLPVIAAKIYSNTCRDGRGMLSIDPCLDWSANYARMLGFKQPEFFELMRLYLTIHSDHGGGNVSAHTTHLVGSALSDPYLAYAAGINGLAGPLHGLASQEVLIWLQQLQHEIGGLPSEAELKAYVQKTLAAGRVIPGYGHSVLRTIDPRFTCQREFALKHLPDDEGVRLVARLVDVVPPLLRELGKVKNPWPNIDAHSGVLLHAFGLKEVHYYTVLFGISRALGVMASLIWDRAMLRPMAHPDCLSSKQMLRLVARERQKAAGDLTKDKSA